MGRHYRNVNYRLVALLKRIYGQKDNTSPAVVFTASDQTGTTIINIAGDVHGLAIPTETAKLLVDPEIIKNVRTVLKPLEQEGYEEIAFLQDEEPVIQIDKKEAKEIIAAPTISVEDTPTESVSDIRGTVRIKAAQYEGGARWSLLWQGRAIDGEMVEKAALWVDNFQHNRIAAPPNTVLDVSMTETVRLNTQGLAIGKPIYSVREIHSTAPPPAQAIFTF